MVRVKISKTGIDNIQNLKEQLDKGQQLAKKLNSPPPAGLIPIGDTGLYRTPDVVDPKDCEHYPDSPWCGGNPISRDAIGLDVDWGVDGCSVHASVTPTLGFTKLPTHTISYIKPECREDYAKRQNEVPPPPEWADDYVPKFSYRPSGYKDNDVVCAVTIQYLFDEEQEYIANLGEWAVAVTSVMPAVKSTDYPGTIRVPNYFPPNQLGDAKANLDAEILSTTVFNEAWAIGVWRDYSNTADRVTVDNIVWQRGIPQDMPTVFDGNYGNWNPAISDGDYAYVGYSITGEGEFIKIHVGKFIDIFPTAQMELFVGGYTEPTRRRKRIAEWRAVFCKKLDGKPAPPFIPFNDRKRDCCMQCCGSQTGQGQQRQQQDLEEIKKMLRQILKNQGTFPYIVTLFDTNEEKQGAQTKNVSVLNIAQGAKLAIDRTEKTNKMVGIDEFPIYVPGSIVKDESSGILGDLKDLKNAFIKKKIGSVAELLAWKVEQDNNIFGKWQEVIEIETSPTQKDKDGKVVKAATKERIVLPNMSRTFKELVLLNQTQIKILGFVMDTTLKLAVDLAGAKLEIAQAHAVIRDIQDFLDYPTEEKLLEVPVQITIPSSTDSVDDKEDLQRFLKESKAKAKYEDWTGEGSFHDLMVTLLDAAAMIRAAFYQRT